MNLPCIHTEFVVWAGGWPPKWLEPNFCIECRHAFIVHAAFTGSQSSDWGCLSFGAGRTDPVLKKATTRFDSIAFCADYRRSYPVACPLYEAKPC